MADNTQYQDDQDDVDAPEQPLQDYSAPSEPPDEGDDTLPTDHPAFDSNIDAHELYDQGYTGASGAEVSRREYDDDNRF